MNHTVVFQSINSNFIYSNHPFNFFLSLLLKIKTFNTLYFPMSTVLALILLFGYVFGSSLILITMRYLVFGSVLVLYC